MRPLIHSNEVSNDFDTTGSNIPRRNAISTSSQDQFVTPTRFEDLPIFLNADYQEHDRQGRDGAVVPNGVPHGQTLMQCNTGYNPPVDPPLALQEEPPVSIHDLDLPIQLSYTSLEAAEISISLLHYTNNWQPPGHIPATQRAREYWVSRLLQAMLDISACQENREKGAFLKRWAPLQSGARNPYYRLEALELICWKLLRVAMDLHSYGTQALGVYDEEALRGTRQDKQLRFEERMDAICELLRTSKTRCDKLLKGEMLVMTVARPCDRMKSVKTNKVSNESRQKNIEEGKKARRKKEQQEREQRAALSSPMGWKRQVELQDEDVHIDRDTPPRKRHCER